MMQRERKARGLWPEVSFRDRDTGSGRCHCRAPGPDTDHSSESFSADRPRKHTHTVTNTFNISLEIETIWIVLFACRSQTRYLWKHGKSWWWWFLTLKAGGQLHSDHCELQFKRIMLHTTPHFHHPIFQMYGQSKGKKKKAYTTQPW